MRTACPQDLHERLTAPSTVSGRPVLTSEHLAGESYGGDLNQFAIGQAAVAALGRAKRKCPDDQSGTDAPSAGVLASVSPSTVLLTVLMIANAAPPRRLTPQ
jgi:hypothetical protein